MSQHLQESAATTREIHTYRAASRRTVICGLLASVSVSALPPRAFAAEDDVAKRFEFLSANGNSNCSAEFLKSIESMPVGARLQGSCCGPMALHRYREQVSGLRAYARFAEIPPDPYDVEAGLAKRLLVNYEQALSKEQQATYGAAMKQSSEGGPCCCQCWRWQVFGGLGKLLIRDNGFDGAQLAKVWDLLDGCGGDSHVH